MNLELDVQIALDSPGLPDDRQLHRWATAALAGGCREQATELVIRMVNEVESEALNTTYRHKQGPTNVLSFPAQMPADIPVNLLGDIVICAPLVMQEAVTQGKPPEAHWAHLVVHGVLHLLGYDHGNDSQARDMEELETRILADLGYPDPYGDVIES
ncbi:MAG: rRNA maturation RNase YbeY [Gammaproteobacteria bacterium]|nr:rRNA maturation RNase YbeY [Gammaproteobacteria bacterium]MCP5423827.1 rRNA maturation RNase YbeY [Gammaproteobacteria bacterium]